MSFSQSPLSGSPLVGAYGVNPTWEAWKFNDYSVYTGIDNNLKVMTSIPMNFPDSNDSNDSQPSPYYSGSDFSGNSPISPTSISIPSTPSSPAEPALPRFHRKSVTSTPQTTTTTKTKTPNEELTPKQLKRRLQNRVSQQAVRRRRNSPARILETRLQELDRQQTTLMELYTNNIDSCIHTLAAEIETLKELKVLLASGSMVPARYNSLLLKTGGIGGGGVSGLPLGAGGSLGVYGNAVGGGVHQSAAYQNHDFDSSVITGGVVRY